MVHAYTGLFSSTRGIILSASLIRKYVKRPTASLIQALVADDRIPVPFQNLVMSPSTARAA